jgi:alkylation response protein AidB-like acyl-CoA dehydrogenase
MQSQTLNQVPQSANRYDDDPILRAIVTRLLPKPMLPKATHIFADMGRFSAGPLDELASLADKNPPQLLARDKFGSRVDEIEFHPAYTAMKELSYGRGIIGNYYGTGKESFDKCKSESVKFVQGYLFSQAEQGLYCPICLTDGTAFLIDQFGTTEQKQEFLPHLTATNLDRLWEGAMFLTEKAGGSDVGAVETIAKRLPNGQYALYGEKWFCSNAGAELAMVLARPEESRQKGTKGLALFALRRHKPDGSLNNLRIERLKDKLGTRSMPTGEIIFDGAIAELVGDVASGFANMVEMLSLSRLYNSVASIGLVRRVLTESLAYSNNRATFGKPLISRPLVRATLVEMAVELEAAMNLIFSISDWRGKQLAGEATEEESGLLRMMLPLAKYSSARLAVRSASEALELHGGNGYIEDWPLARFYRDAQVLPVWEGTTNILVLDAIRAIIKQGCHEAFFNFVERANVCQEISDATKELKQKLKELLGDTSSNSSAHESYLTRHWCDRAVQIFQATLLMQNASDERAQLAAENYMLRYFSGDKDSLTPSYGAHAESNSGTLLAISKAQP